jgi:carboxymethylenebutenolidase
MKKIIIVAALLFSTVAFGQKHSCCSSSDWSTLALNTDFMASHLSPEPLAYSPEESSSMVSFSTVGKDGAAFFVPSPKPTKKVLIISHEWWGLNDYIKREAERWQKMLGNIDVYAVDLYEGKVAATPEEAGKYMSELDVARGNAILKGLLNKIGKDKDIISLGWCMGGSWSFATALNAGKQAKGCVMYYGFPETDMNKIKLLKTDVLYIYGTQDKYITKEAITAFEKDIKKTGNGFKMYSYDAVHAFANPSNPKYDKVNAGDAETKVLSYIKNKLK